MGVAGRASGSLAGSAAGSLSPALGTLVSWSALTYAGASQRYIWDTVTKTLHGPYAGGVPAIATINGKRWYQAEGAETNRSDVVSAWTIRGAVVRTAGQADPAGGTGAYLLENLGVAGHDAFGSVTNSTADAQVGGAVFVLRQDSADTWQIRNRQMANGWDVDNTLLTDQWERVTRPHPATSQPASGLVNDAVGNFGFSLLSAGNSTDVKIWQPQATARVFASSPIPEATTRAADAASLSAAQVPERVRSGRWSTKVTMEFSGDDLANSDQHMLAYLDASNFLVIEKTGGGVYQVRLATTGGDITRTVTNSREQTVQVVVDFAAGELTLSGFTTGDGVASGTVSNWPSSTMHIGKDSGSGKELFGLISEFEAA